MMDLTAYRKKVNRRLNWLRAAWLGFLLMELLPRFIGELDDSQAYSVLLGFSAVGLLIAAFRMLKLRLALRDEAALRRLYNREHDERISAIRAKAGYPITLIFGLTMFAAGLFAFPFDQAVGSTLIFAALVQLLVCALVKVYYMRKM